MKIVVIGKGAVGGSLARLWTSAGHEVRQIGRAGGDASASDVVVLAVPNQAVPGVLENVTGLGDTIVIDATNRLSGETPPAGHSSIAEFVKSTTGATVAKAFNLNYGDLFGQAADAAHQPGNIWVGDEGARAAVERLSSDVGMRALRGGPLERAATQEEFGYLMNSIVDELGGLFFYRFALPHDM